MPRKRNGTSLSDRVGEAMAFYDSRRFKGRDKALEPSWILPPFTSLYRVADGANTKDDAEATNDALEALKDLSGTHLQSSEDGFEIGTAS